MHTRLLLALVGLLVFGQTPATTPDASLVSNEPKSMQATPSRDTFNEGLDRLTEEIEYGGDNDEDADGGNESSDSDDETSVSDEDDES